jgi:PAS domain S-box-containing protein
MEERVRELGTLLGLLYRQHDTTVVYSPRGLGEEGRDRTVAEEGRPRRIPTDQRLLQQTLLGEAADNARIAVFVFDDDGNSVAVNAWACELTGFTRAELLGADLLPLSPRRSLAERLLARSRDGTRSSGRGTLRRKDGRKVPVEYRIAETQIAGNQFYVSICWPLPRRAPRARLS